MGSLTQFTFHLGERAMKTGGEALAALTADRKQIQKRFKPVSKLRFYSNNKKLFDNPSKRQHQWNRSEMKINTCTF